MTEDDARDIVERIGESIVSGANKEGEVNGTPIMEPACEAAAREMELDHEYFHAMVNSFGVVAQIYGCSDLTFCFIIGRKWGLMEAQEMLSGEVPDAPE